jgi:hypothetical protein
VEATRGAILPWDGGAVTVAYLACGKTKHAVIAPGALPVGGKPLPTGVKLIKRGLTATGAERVANRVNAVALAVRRLS